MEDLENPKGLIGSTKLPTSTPNEKDRKAKAWDIVINKFVDLALLKRCHNLISYNMQTYGQRLEQDEFDFLKEMTDTK